MSPLQPYEEELDEELLLLDEQLSPLQPELELELEELLDELLYDVLVAAAVDVVAVALPQP